MLVLLSSAGGITAALTSVIIAVRAIFRQVSATEDNTRALNSLTAEVRELRAVTGGHETRIAVLEDRRRRRRPW